MARSVLLLGATGLIGNHCLHLLLQDESYEKVIAFVRSPMTLSHPKLEQCQVDYEQMERHTAPARVHDVFCCLGTTIKKAGSQAAFRRVDFEYPLQIAQLALREGAQQFLLVSSLGAHPASPVFYSRVKGEVEAALTKLPFRALHIFRPSLLLGERPEFRLGEKIGEYAYKATSFLWQGPLRKYRPITAQTVAAAMVHLAKQDQSGIHIHESFQISKYNLAAGIAKS